MEKRFVKGSEEWVIFQDFYKLCQKVWIIEDSDKYWNHVKEEIDNFWQKYKDDIFAKHLGFSILNTLEEKVRNTEFISKEKNNVKE